MVRKSSLENRFNAVLSEKTNRRRVSARLFAVTLILGTTVVIPLAMLQAGPEKETSKGISVDVAAPDHNMDSCRERGPRPMQERRRRDSDWCGLIGLA